MISTKNLGVDAVWVGLDNISPVAAASIFKVRDSHTLLKGVNMFMLLATVIDRFG